MMDLAITFCTSSPYIHDTFKRIKLFYFTFAEALHFEIDKEEHF